VAAEIEHAHRDGAEGQHAGAASTARGEPPFRRRQLVLGLLLCVGLAAAMLLSLAVGAVSISPFAVAGALFAGHPLTGTQHVIVFELRLPRILASALVGAALAISGLLFQGLFRNPMADPYVIGSSGGAVIGAAFGIFFFSQLSFFGFSATAILAFAGSAATMALVYSLARSRGRTEVVTLLLAGFAVSTILGNSTYLFEVMNTSTGTRILLSWLRGVIGIPQWSQLSIAAALTLLATIASVPLMRQLNTLALGDEYAHQLGLRVEFARAGIILVGSLLTAVAVSLGGLISFAGLIVPHIARLLLGPDNTRLLPVTALGGAIFLVLTDTLARTLFAPSEVPVGVLMALVGGPFFLYLLRQSKGSYGL
jgi:iron complex transport system permease protein